MSNRKKRLQLIGAREKKRGAQERREIVNGLRAGTVIPVDPARVVSRSWLPNVPEYYRDRQFSCVDCGTKEIWTARQQKRWHEEQGGEIEAIAIRCRACRRKEKLRRETARKIHLEGLTMKQENASKPTEWQK